MVYAKRTSNGKGMDIFWNNPIIHARESRLTGAVINLKISGIFTYEQKGFTSLGKYF